MVATHMQVIGSATAFGEFGFSGTQFDQQGAVQLCLMMAMSGLAIIPVKCDSTGRIGSVF